MEPKIWGSSLWYLIHLLCFTFIPVYQNEYHTFIHGLKTLIPCHKCRVAYNRELNSRPPKYNNLKQWSIDLHNSVNKRLRKKIFSNEDVEKTYYNENGTLKIDHNKINHCIKLIINNNGNTGKCKEFVSVLQNIYPDTYTRNKLGYVFAKGGETFNKTRNMGQLRKWMSNEFNICGKQYDIMDPAIFNF